MFFKKNKKELGDQFAVFHERDVPRFASGGGIAIEGFEGEARVKNVSASGCCLESVTYAALVPDKVYRLTISPGEGSPVKAFNILMKLNWARSSEMLFEAGFSLDAPKGSTHKDPMLERYIAQLRNEGVQPEYGNMRQERR
jgi:hypothetical protein